MSTNYSSVSLVALPYALGVYNRKPRTSLALCDGAIHLLQVRSKVLTFKWCIIILYYLTVQSYEEYHYEKEAGPDRGARQLQDRWRIGKKSQTRT